MPITSNKDYPFLEHNEITLDYLSSLNPKQKEAVLYDQGPLLILAGAGTGKTKVLTSKIINLVKENKAYPSQILAVTFTNKAAKEMMHRVSGFIPSDGLWLSTFHAIAAKILRRHAEIFNLSSNFTILGMDDQLRLTKSILKEQNIDEKKYPAKYILGIIQRWKDLGLFPFNISNSDLYTKAHSIAKDIYFIYQSKLKFLDSVDFGDLLIYNIELFTKNHDILALYHQKFKYILVDEYQDTNIAQYMWLRLLTNKDQNLCCVGDEDQSIYGWRGAEIDNILRFEKDFPNAKIIKLEQNYRSTNNILDAASSLISYNNNRIGKKLWADSSSGEKIKIATLMDGNEEASYISKIVAKQNIPYKNIAILVRAGYQTRLFEENFINYGISYQIIGGTKFYERQEIKDILSYIRIAVNPGDSLALERIINLPKRGIGPSTLASIIVYAENKKIAILPAIGEMIQNNLFKPKIKSSLQELITHFANWSELFATHEIKFVVEKILDDSGYKKMWQNETNIEAETRLENIKEFLSAIKNFNNINEFLEHVSLVSDNESANSDNSVSIMTIHAAKGLEFEMVILPGWEENIFPHQRSIAENAGKGLEEERRLAYVAITRAKRNLIITNAISRNIFGQFQTSIPSRFIAEIPEENVERIERNDFYQNPYLKPQMNPSIIVKNKRFNIGERIYHDKFGYGYILGMIDDQLEISFDNLGIKRLLENFIKKAS